MAIFDTNNVKYKNETNPKFKFIKKGATCVNTDCTKYCKCSLNKLKSCKDSYCMVEVIGIEKQITELFQLLKNSKMTPYNNTIYPFTYFKGNSIKMIAIDNRKINSSFEKHCNKFDLIQINGDNPFI